MVRVDVAGVIANGITPSAVISEHAMRMARIVRWMPRSDSGLSSAMGFASSQCGWRESQSGCRGQVVDSSTNCDLREAHKAQSLRAHLFLGVLRRNLQELFAPETQAFS